MFKIQSRCISLKLLVANRLVVARSRRRLALHVNCCRPSSLITHTVIQKNFQVNNSQAFDHIPAQELYIFPGSEDLFFFFTRWVHRCLEAPPPSDAVAPTSPQGTVPNPFTFSFSKVNASQLSGGTAKIADSSTFAVVSISYGIRER